jgi:arylsulfatase A-like enzyme
VRRFCSNPLLLSLLLFFPACGTKPGAVSPNVIILVMDTTRAGRCSVNGYERETTPALEALAREGINFRNTWSPSGWAGPAHASIFTGRLPERHGFRRGNRLYLDDSFTTLAERLEGAGYRSACLTNNPAVTREFGLAQGFDDYFPLHLDAGRSYPAAPATHRKAIDWAQGARKRGVPFFLFINDVEPHSPYCPPESFREKFVDPSIDPATVQHAMTLSAVDFLAHNLGLEKLPETEIAVLSDLYDAEIACLDQAIGQFIAELRTGDLLDHTLLIITSDHGENLGEHGLMGNLFSLHRTVRQVPLIVRLPGGERAGEVNDEVARLEDICPTVLEVCGLVAPDDLDGQSLLGDLTDRRARATASIASRLIATLKEKSEPGSDPEPFPVGLRAVFDGRLHWILRSDGRIEVFDLLVDPGESGSIAEVGSGTLPGRPPRRRTQENELRPR